jgi:hypothetical protein
MVARTVIPTNVIVLDLDTPYTVSSLTEGGREVDTSGARARSGSGSR